MCSTIKSNTQARGHRSNCDCQEQRNGEGKGNDSTKGKGKDRSASKEQNKGKGKAQSRNREEDGQEIIRKHTHKHKHKRSDKTNSQSKVPRITHWGFPLTMWPRFLMRPPVFGRHLEKGTKRDSTGTKRFSKLHLYSHTPQQISTAILSAPSRSGAKTRAKAIKRFHELLKQPDQQPEDAELLFKYFKVFDRIFFHGVLTGLCCVHVAKKLDDEGVNGDCCTAGVEGFANIKYRYEAQIRILDIRGRVEYEERQEARERLGHYLKILLHECVHAVLGLYSCRIHSACRERERRAVGEDGHLSVWQEIAHGIEAATEGALGVRFDLDRMSRLSNDLAASKKLKMPTREELLRWSIDPIELMREIEARGSLED